MSRNSRIMACPPESVFDVLSNGWLFAAWVVGAARTSDVDPQWPTLTPACTTASGSGRSS